MRATFNQILGLWPRFFGTFFTKKYAFSVYSSTSYIVLQSYKHFMHRILVLPTNIGCFMYILARLLLVLPTTSKNDLSISNLCTTLVNPGSLK